MEGFSKEKLKRIRLQLGLSQRAVPGVAQDTLSALESGRREPRPSTLKRLAAAYGVEVRDFFEEATPSPKEAGPLSSEWAITTSVENLRRTIESTPTERLESVVLDLVSRYQPRSLEDLANESPEEVHRRVVSFSRAGIIGEELERRGERPPERYVLALKRFQDAMTGGVEVVRDQNQQTKREAG